MSHVDKPSHFRPPAVPLAVIDPYFSVWSFADRLTDEETRHWTGARHPLGGMLRIDGKAFRFSGPAPKSVPAMAQTSCEVYPTRTIYKFQARGVELTLTFLTPMLPHDLTLFSWPVTWIQFSLASSDGRAHEVSLYFDVSSQLAVDDEDQTVGWGRLRVEGLDVQFCGTTEQKVLARVGDNCRIDWGYLYLAVPDDAGAATAIRSKDAGHKAFAAGKRLPEEDASNFPHGVRGLWPKLTCLFEDMQIAGDAAPSNRFVVLAYDDGYSLEYHHRHLRPYWRRAGLEVSNLLKAAKAEYSAVFRKCAEFDAELMADLERVGGRQYAQLCALGFRQCCAAHKLAVDFDGTLIYLSKECHSNGCIATVDVTYPSAPFFLALNPALLQAQIQPLLDYACSPRWKFPFAPHDLGIYPKANGQVYGGGEISEEDQMPVEECGNMLLLTAGLVQSQQSTSFAETYFEKLREWAEYLVTNGFDPAKQLCTDDFAGRLSHNANLSLKSILAVGAFAQLCAGTRRHMEAQRYWKIARDWVVKWQAQADDGDHYRRAFDKPETWSLKYNLVWDSLLELNLFPSEISRRELVFLRGRMQRYGLPLDDRKRYGKLDWMVWIATMAEDRADFEFFVEPLYRWAHETRSRVPLTDWYWTHNGEQVHYGRTQFGKLGFQARSVVGGLMSRLLADKPLAAKWRERSLRSHATASAGVVTEPGYAKPPAAAEG